jgi:hypothetical protein
MYFTLSVKKKAHICIILALLFIPPRMVVGADLEKQKEALEVIGDFADRLCMEVNKEGRTEQIELSGKAKADLNNLLRRIADLGIEGAGKYQSESWQGVLQQDLADLMNNTQDCRLEVWRDLKDKLLVFNFDPQSKNDSRILQQAEKVAIDWLAGFIAKDIHIITKLASMPFYSDQVVLISKEDLRKTHEEVFKGKTNQMDALKIVKLKTRTIRQFKEEEGNNAERDRVLKNIYLVDSDFAVSIVIEKKNRRGEVRLFVRTTEDGLRVAGMWD